MPLTLVSASACWTLLAELASSLAPAMYPGGRSYSGCHGWAIPKICGDVAGAVALVTRLASIDAGRLEAAAGGIPAHEQALAQHEPIDDIDSARLAITKNTIADAMCASPPTVKFPAGEDAG